MLVRCLACLTLFASNPWLRAETHHLADNFTLPLPSTAEVSCQADFETPHTGLAAARIAYRIDPARRNTSLALADMAKPVAGPGLLKVWVRGDGSANEMEFVLRHARVNIESDGRRTLHGHANLALPRVRLDFQEWREVALDARGLPAGNAAWWHLLNFHAPRADGSKLEGIVMLDDLRLFPSAAPPEVTFAAGLIGPTVRDFTRDITLFADVRNFTAKTAKVQARITMTDRNENRVADRDFRIELAPGEAKEARLELAPENLESYLPPFRLAGDLLSGDLPQVSARWDYNLVMGNSLLLFDDFSDLHGRWFTAGYGSIIRHHYHNWTEWTHGQGQRASPLAQTAASISRGEISNSGDPAPASALPPGRYALRLDYAGDTAVYSSGDRYLPGNAFRLGVWVKGNGSGDSLSALILDYTDSGDFWTGGWRRIWSGERTLCTLNFDGWRYIEVDLPGNGLGTNIPKGSTDALDFPLELTAFRIQVAKEKAAGTVWIGPVFVHTQQPSSSALAVHLGYDDPHHLYAGNRRAWATVHNGGRAASREIRSAWLLLDRAGERIAGGQNEQEIPAGKLHVFPVELEEHVAAIAPRLGPLRLQVTAADTADVSFSASREIILAKPDSVSLLSNFEFDRGYLGLKADGITTAPPHGESATFTSPVLAHSGKRSLAIPWDKEKRKSLFVSIDPPLAGIPVELTVWVHGDGSGVLFYPLLGDRMGAPHGLGSRQWDLFLPRTADGPLHNAVRVDWQGWRELKFYLPIIPPSWDKALPILAWWPSYPLGVHLALDAGEASAEKGILYADDISARTHLEPRARLSMALERVGESNVRMPGGQVEITLANEDAAAPHKGQLLGGVFDWRGNRVAAVDLAVELLPGQRVQQVVAKDLPTGAYAVRLALQDSELVTLAAIEEDLLVADLRPFLGNEWAAEMRDEWKLRKPIQDSFTFVDEDWDWVEHHPGNLQLDTLRDRARGVSSRGASPYMLIGYSAYWVAGTGFEQMKAGAYSRRQRDVGHAVDIFLIPERLEDWDNYVYRLMRNAGKDVAGWVVWNNPDGHDSLAVKPQRFAQMLQIAGKWRQTYCPETPLLIGGLSRESAIPYLTQVAEHGSLDSITGVNVRMDVGRLSPEDARLPSYVRALQAALQGSKENPKTILLTDLDWAVEKDSSGLNAFDQAAYLIRSDLLLDSLGLRPALSIRNEDYVRWGLGLTYRRALNIPPLTERVQTFQLKPAWWGVARARQWLDQFAARIEIEVQDVIPDRTRCILYERKSDGRPVAIIWRNDNAGYLSFTASGVAVESAEDMFGSPVAAQNGWYPVGKLPEVFVLQPSPEAAAQALARLWVRDGDKAAWPQRTLAVFTPFTGQRQNYAQTGGERAALSGLSLNGDKLAWEGLRFSAGGSERFEVNIPDAPAGLVLRKRFFLDDSGHEAEVNVNGNLVGRWDLRRTDTKLSGGLREAAFLIQPSALAVGRQAVIEVRYSGPVNTAAWRVFEFDGGDFPLSALGPIHADQNIGHPRIARNVVGNAIQVGNDTYANGIGVFANSLIEYPLNRQFRRFKAKAGIDAATEGKGSVVFEILADGKKIWSSSTVSGIDPAREIDLDVQGVNRLRLVVTDAGDGNKFDAADWCDPGLERVDAAGP